jgi:hypothetical protein
VAEETVSGEPVCEANSLLTGKRSENFGIMAQLPQAGAPMLKVAPTGRLCSTNQLRCPHRISPCGYSPEVPLRGKA